MISDATENYLQYGLAVIVTMAVTVPIVRRMLRRDQMSDRAQQAVTNELLKLLRQSVDTNTQAVRLFELHQERERTQHAELRAGQGQILERLDRMQCHAQLPSTAPVPPGPVPPRMPDPRKRG